MTEEYGAIVVGGGPAGYVAAIRLGQLGVRTLSVEREECGGVCLNWGCIPSKAVIGVARQWQALRRAEGMGITVSGAALDRALSLGEAEGLVKVVADANRVLGVGIVGPEASELIAEATFAVEMMAAPEDVGLTIHTHPTLSEAMHEAMRHAVGEAVHVLNGPARRERRVPALS